MTKVPLRPAALPARAAAPPVRTAVVAGLALATLAAGCAGSGRTLAPAAKGEDLGARTRALETAVRRDRARLVELVATPRPEGAPPLRDDPELRAIAERLPANEERLAALAARAAEPGPAAPPSAAADVPDGRVAPVAPRP